jgi:hypothetical protein
MSTTSRASRTLHRREKHEEGPCAVMNKRGAARSSWKASPMSTARAAIPLTLQLSPDEYERLRAGSAPEDMDEQWLIFCEDGWVHFHHSWIGHCIFAIRIEQDGDGYVVREAWATRDHNQYRNEDVDEDVRLLKSVIFHCFGIDSEPLMT